MPHATLHGDVEPSRHTCLQCGMCYCAGLSQLLDVRCTLLLQHRHQLLLLSQLVLQTLPLRLRRPLPST